MLQLKKVYKNYTTKCLVVRALKDINVSFRDAEYVAILGASGCGKTTLLNIIGGLDKYAFGDLLLDNVSTRTFKDRDWDIYRNKKVGFVFQNYNLIPHQTILSNVELALTLCGTDAKTSKEAALKTLDSVGLKGEAYKYPNQLSGGQMQRVAIARALVNNPSIILADEPTGALDSESSKQVCELLKKISRDRLVIMVTHNAELAAKYATRLIKMNSGQIIYDSLPLVISDATSDIAEIEIIEDKKNDTTSFDNMDFDTLVKEIEDSGTSLGSEWNTQHTKQKLKSKTNAKSNRTPKPSLKFGTACSLSMRNLLTKKLRTALTSVAGAIGIIGIALVMAVSNGVSLFMTNTEADTLSSMPISINTKHVKLDNLLSSVTGNAGNKDGLYPNDDRLIIDDPVNRFFEQHYNRIDETYLRFVNNIDKSHVNDIHLSNAVSFNLMSHSSTGYNVINIGKKNNTGMAGSLEEIYFTLTGARSARMYEMVNDNYLQSQYEVIEGSYPTQMNEVAILVNRKNALNADVVNYFGLDLDQKNLKISDLLDQKLSLINHNDFYTKGINGDKRRVYYMINDSTNSEEKAKVYNKGLKLKVTAVMRVREDISSEMFDTGILYRPELTDYFIGQNRSSDIVKAQQEFNKYDIITGKNFDMKYIEVLGITEDDLYNENLKYLCGMSMVDGELKKSVSDIYIYPKDIKSKEKITAYLDSFNTNRESVKTVLYNDPSKILTNSLSSIVNGVSIALVCIAGISLLVSTIMIAIITYVSVLERTKEIGILRALGARKIDIAMLFNTETAIIGSFAGVVGVGLGWLLTLPFNAIINSLFSGVAKINLLVLNPIVALILLVISVVLTIVAGLIPSYLASKCDPVKALRTD